MAEFFITKDKKLRLEEELTSLKSEGRADIAEKLDSAKALGDLKENAEYHQAREDQAKMESRILEIEGILKNCTLIKSHSSDQVELGVNVVIAKKGSPKHQEFQIVGEQEADISLGKLSHNSPLAKAMISKKSDDTFEFQTPSGETFSYRIIEIK